MFVTGMNELINKHTESYKLAIRLIIHCKIVNAHDQTLWNSVTIQDTLLHLSKPPNKKFHCNPTSSHNV